MRGNTIFTVQDDIRGNIQKIGAEHIRKYYKGVVLPSTFL